MSKLPSLPVVLTLMGMAYTAELERLYNRAAELIAGHLPRTAPTRLFTKLVVQEMYRGLNH